MKRATPEVESTKRHRRDLVDKSELNLFTHVPQQNAIESCRIESIATTCPLPSHEISIPLDFVIKGTNEFIDPNIFLHLQLQLLRSDGAELVELVYDASKKRTGGDSVALVNYPLMTMWSSVEHFINNTEVSTTQRFHPWLAYTSALRRFRPISNDTILKQSGFIPGRDDSNDDFQFNSAGSQFLDLFDLTKKSAVLDICGPLLCDTLDQGRLFLSEADMLFRFHRASPQFALMADANDTYNYRIVIRQAELLVRRVTLTADRSAILERQLLSTPAIYPYVRSDCRMIPVTANQKNIDMEVWSTTIPRRVTLVQLSQKGYNGSYNFNPFVFQSFTIENIAWELNGKQMPSKPFQMDWSKKVAAAYISSMISTMTSQDVYSDITPGLFAKGYAMFIQDLTPDMCAGSEHTSAESRGSLRLKIDYKTPSTTPFVILCIGEFENSILIDSKRKVLK
jgi:hypothetical protein